MVRDRRDEPQRSSASETEAPIASLVVYLHREAHRCIASFSGALTAATRATIDGVADLLAGEQLVVFDFSRVDVIDTGGSDAVDVLVNSVRAHGTSSRNYKDIQCPFCITSIRVQDLPAKLSSLSSLRLT